MKFDTKVIHAGIEPDPSTGAIMTPIFQTSTYVQAAPGDHKGYEYARTQNPTRTALEANIAALENARFGLAFASGMAAIDAIVKLLKPGDHVISTSDLYGGTYRIFTKVFQKYGISFDFTPMATPEEVEALVTPATKMIWLETPTNPMLNIIDISAMAAVAKVVGAWLVVDNTFASPYLQNPIDLGADIVVHSATKYLGGHSDIISGLIATNSESLYVDLKFLQNSCGAVPGPQDCFLALRGIKTLHIRMDRHCSNASEIAHFLKGHPAVGDVIWPGFKDHPGHDTAKRQMRNFGGMVSFRLKSDRLEDAVKVLKRSSLFACAESLGGVESLIGHPATMTHGSIPAEERAKTGVTDTLIRLSVGIEDISDLIADLEHSLA
jgi:cystathionine beta-lyase